MGSIYDRKNVPGIRCMYLYYVDPDNLENNRVYCYWDDRNAIDDVNRRIGLLIESAYGAKDDPPPCGQYLLDVSMRRVSYLVIVGKQGTEIDQQHPLEIVDWTDNTDEADHTFCNAERRVIPTRVGNVTAAVVVNRMRNKAANGPLEPHKHDWFRLRCYDVGGDNIIDGRGYPHEHESGGTNLGPPVSPP